jgi:hypothetical protein
MITDFNLGWNLDYQQVCMESNFHLIKDYNLLVSQEHILGFMIYFYNYVLVKKDICD